MKTISLLQSDERPTSLHLRVFSSHFYNSELTDYFTGSFKRKLVLILTVLMFCGWTQSSLGQKTNTAVDFRQSANNDTPVPPYGLGNVHWINSILQNSNSVYYEGMSSLQRIIFQGIAPVKVGNTTSDNHSLTFFHDATKLSANAHAYDFLTSWEQGVAAAASIAPVNTVLFIDPVNACGPEPASDSQGILALCTTLHATAAGGPYLTLVDIPDNMGSVLGDDVAAKAAGYETRYGNRQLKIYSSAPITAFGMTFNGYTGNSSKTANYTLNWTSTSANIVIEFAGHLAVGTDPLFTGVDPNLGYGATRGSGGISGGPYHITLDKLDGHATGGQDNQIKSADILIPCNLTVAITAPVVCGGTATTVTATPSAAGTYSYVWTVPATATDPGNVDHFDTSIAGQYSVVITNTVTSCAANNSAMLEFYDRPTVIVSAPSVCMESDATITAEPTPLAGTYSYEWTVPATATDPGNQASFTTAVEGEYEVIITDANGCTGTNKATLSFYDRPTVIVSAPSECEGTDATVTAEPTPTAGTYSYEWTVPATATDPGNQASFTTAVEGEYEVTITDANGCTGTNKATLSFYDRPTVIVSAPAVCEGADATVTAEPTPAEGTYSYAWTVPTDATDPGNQASFTTSVEGQYDVIITDESGCTGNGGANVSFTPSPVCPYSDSVLGVLANLEALADGSLTIDDIPDATFAWSLTGTGWSITNNSQNSRILTFHAGAAGSTGDFSLTITKDGCSSTPCTRSVTLDAPPPPAGHLYPTATTCCSFRNETAQPFTQVCYTIKKGKIFTATPGVMFYYTKYTATSEVPVTIIINQGQTCGLPPFEVQQAQGKPQIILWDGECDKVVNGTIVNGVPQVTIQNPKIDVVYVISVKYNVKSIEDVTAPVGDCQYTFFSTIGGAEIDGSRGMVTVSANCSVVVDAGINDCSLTARLAQEAAPAEGLSNSNLADFEVYPVPFKDQLTIRCNFDYKTDVKIEMFDILGRTIFTHDDNEVFVGKEIVLNPGSIHRGAMYFIKVTTNRGYEIKKIISGK